MRLTKCHKWGLISGVIVIIAFLWFTREIAPPLLTDKENLVMETLFKNAKPQCIGRYIINTPESFNNQLKNQIFIDDFTIESQYLYLPAFKQRIALREKELREWVPSVENAPALKEVIFLPENKGVIFDRNAAGQDDLRRILEAHVYVDHIAFIITVEILDLSNPKYIERKKVYKNSGFSEYDMNEKPKKLAAIKSLISRLSGRLDHEILTEKGVCIPNGFIQDDGSQHKENLYFLYENSDFRLAIHADNRVPASEDTLLNRAAEIKKSLVLHNRYTFKKGVLKPNGIPSQEWLIAGSQDVYNHKENKIESGLPYYYFIFNANQETSSFTTPYLDISMFNDDKATQYSDSEMVEIWDRIIGSLRYRPNAF